jgi:hypothetical protein
MGAHIMGAQKCHIFQYNNFKKFDIKRKIVHSKNKLVLKKVYYENKTKKVCIQTKKVSIKKTQNKISIQTKKISIKKTQNKISIQTKKVSIKKTQNKISIQRKKVYYENKTKSLYSNKKS